ncbi:hypothetical protein [Cohnella fermenti]|uniref:hypothetical protein n=1 Tax=Cohnella fermenti TaxID=2565925 RepID=UPI001454C2AE|nr:hypothetical protein [Cohnella fermenti]
MIAVADGDGDAAVVGGGDAAVDGDVAAHGCRFYMKNHIGAARWQAIWAILCEK